MYTNIYCLVKFKSIIFNSAFLYLKQSKLNQEYIKL